MKIEEKTTIKYFDIVLLADKKDSFFNIFSVLIPKYFKADTNEEKNFIYALRSEIKEFSEYHQYFDFFPNGHCKLTEKGRKAKKKGGHLKYEEYTDNNDFDKIDINIDNLITGDNYGIQSSNSDFKSPIKQKTVHKTATPPKNKSWIEIFSWTIGIIAGLIAIYEFLIKKLIE